MRKVRVEASFAGDRASVSACRAFVEATLAAWDCDDPERIAVLLTSELVTNAIVHAAGDVRVGLALENETVLEVEVADGSSDLPELLPLDTASTGGKGLWLVEQLARAWGTRRTGGGKVVWFRVPVRCHWPPGPV